MPVELLSEAQWRILKGDVVDAVEVEFEGKNYFVAPPAGVLHEEEEPVKKNRRLSGGMNPISRAIKDLNRELSSIQDRIKKLEAIRSGSKEDLGPLIEKWKVACQSIIMELFKQNTTELYDDLDLNLGKFGHFLHRLGLDRESRHELDYDSDDDSFQ